MEIGQIFSMNNYKFTRAGNLGKKVVGTEYTYVQHGIVTDDDFVELYFENSEGYNEKWKKEELIQNGQKIIRYTSNRGNWKEWGPGYFINSDLLKESVRNKEKHPRLCYPFPIGK